MVTYFYISIINELIIVLFYFDDDNEKPNIGFSPLWNKIIFSFSEKKLLCVTDDEINLHAHQVENSLN